MPTSHAGREGARKAHVVREGRRPFGFRRRRDLAGGVNMEYVILGVLIAAAVIVAVLMFSRTIASMFIVAGDGVTTREQKAKQELDGFRTDRDKDAQTAKDYHDSMHE